MLNLNLILAEWADPSWTKPEEVRWILTAAYLTVLLLVSIYGIHRYWLVFLYYRNLKRMPRPARRFEELPLITVQLPMFNERYVAERIIDAACHINYPRHLLQVQVLDDSTDDSGKVAEARVRYWQNKGFDIQYIHRDNRGGYKAGALENGMKDAKGQFIAIFDADFVPEPDFLRKTIHYFTDPKVGMVQCKWDHINRDSSMLTKSQAIFLDGHFVIEHTARNRSDRWINFNGTAGMWRKQAIETAGGWQHDTLTEDVDLSYRSQLQGWKFIFLPKVGCPAELPPEINAFKSQQHRWTKGSIQTAKKLLPTLFSADIPASVKVEAFFHLTSPMCYLYITLMALLFYPAIAVNMQVFEDGSWARMLVGCSLFAMGTVSAGMFYVASQRAQKRSGWSTVLQMPLLMAVGIGIALNNARGCIEALFGHESPFVVTPKYNAAAKARSRQVLPTPTIKTWMSALEILMGLYMVNCIIMAANAKHAFISITSIPFLAIFAGGYFYVGFSSLWSQVQNWPVWRLRPATA